MFYRQKIKNTAVILILLAGMRTGPSLAYNPIGPQKQTVTPQSTHGLISVPPYLIQNKGQMDARVKFYKNGSGHLTSFTEDGVYITLAASQNEKTQTIRLFPVGAEGDLKPRAEAKLNGKVNYYLGNDKKKWKSGIPTYGQVTYKEVYPGIDMKFYGNKSDMEYDVVVHPGADLNKVRLGYEGIKNLRVTPTGELEVVLKKGGSLFQKKPHIYQDVDGKFMPIEGAFRLHKGRKDTYSFQVTDYNKRYPLIIDPVVSYSTYLGGTLEDQGQGIAVDDTGHVYVTGSTLSIDFPITDSSINKGGHDIFVTKIKIDTTATSSLIYSTYLGGSGEDIANDIAIDGSGAAYITGETSSTDLPNETQLGPGLTKENRKKDAFIIKINGVGQSIRTTHLIGQKDDIGYSIAIDRDCDQDCAAYITGESESFESFATTTPPLQGDNIGTGTSKVFVAKVDPAGLALNYLTYLGGGNDLERDAAKSIAVDKDGNVYITGNTAGDFPIRSPYQANRKGNFDAFVTKINSAGSAILYSTYLGGNNDDEGSDIALDNNGNAYITGFTSSTDFQKNAPLEGTTCSDGTYPDAFIAKIDTTATATLQTSLVYAACLGGADRDEGHSIAVDSNGAVYVTGETDSNDFPTFPLPPLQRYKAGGTDIFITKLTSDGKFDYSTYFGGSGFDTGKAIAFDVEGVAYITGSTQSLDFLTVSPLQKAHAGKELLTGDGIFYQEAKFSDAFITKIGKSDPDTIPFTIKDFFPPNGAMSLGFAGSPIRATFSKPINPNIVRNSDAFKVQALMGGQVLGTLSYDVELNQVIFTPRQVLEKDTTYTVEISNEVTDLAGNPLTPFTWSFSTSAAPPEVIVKKKGFCFIATAAYGSYLDPHVMVLRGFRDRYLLTNKLGQVFVDFYYTYSPPLADYIQSHEGAKLITRWLLTPVIYGVAYPGISLTLIGMFLMTIIFFCVKKQRER